MEEEPKKEETQEKAGKEESQAEEKNMIPLYLGVLFLVLGLVAGYTIRAYLNPATINELECPGESNDLPPALPEPEPTEKTPIKATIIYSEACNACGNNTSFQLVLERNGLEYKVERVEAGSEEGKKLIEEYELFYVPAMLIEPDSVKEGTVVKTHSGQDVGLKLLLEKSRVKDRYVLPEADLDKIRPKYVVEKPDEKCEIGEKVPVLLFCDPYDSSCVINMRKFTDIKEKFSDLVDFEYLLFPTVTNDLMADFNYADLTAKHLVCAKQQNKFFELDEEIKTIYCDKSGERNLNNQELEGCPLFNDRWNKPLIIEEIKAAEKRAEVDEDKMNECLGRVDNLIKFELNKGKTYGINIIPMAVVGCQYFVEPLEIEKIICELKPEAEACKEAAKEAEEAK